MPLPTVPCVGTFTVNVTGPDNTVEPRTLFFECVKVKKVFDEFVLRDCVECIKFELECIPKGGEIQPVLILRHGKVRDIEIKDVSTDALRRLRFSGKCCFEVYGKDARGNLIRMRVIELPKECTNLSIGPDGELCFNFSIRREYPDATQENFESVIHFLEQGRFELQCFAEAIIDENRNMTDCEILVTNLGIFVAIKFDAEVQLCVPVLGYCAIEEAISPIDDFCEEFDFMDIPSFNPMQLDRPISPYND